VWVSYDEGLLNGRANMNTMKITAPTTSETTHPLYFDLIRLVENLARQSRDKVVPTLDPDMYSPNNFWQQTYRWSQVSFVYSVLLLFKLCHCIIVSVLHASKFTARELRSYKLLLLFKTVSFHLMCSCNSNFARERE